MAVSKRLRVEIFRRDNYTCQYCGGRAPDVTLTIDHVTPVALGGVDAAENLVAACRDCNAGKSATAPDAPQVAAVPQATLRWQAALKQAAELAQTTRAVRDRHRAVFSDEWGGWTYTATGQPIPLPDGWEATVDRLLAAGLTDADLVDAIRLTMNQKMVDDKLAYCAGICWRWVTDRQETARQILEQERQQVVAPYSDDEHWSDVIGEIPELADLVVVATNLMLRARAEIEDFDLIEAWYGYPRFTERFGTGIKHRMTRILEPHDWPDTEESFIYQYLMQSMREAWHEASA